MLHSCWELRAEQKKAAPLRGAATTHPPSADEQWAPRTAGVSLAIAQMLFDTTRHGPGRHGADGRG